MTLQTIEIAKIDATGRLRPINPTWVETLSEALQAGDRLPPIEVVERSGSKEATHRLIVGGHRLAAHAAAGRQTIEAEVYTAAEFADEAAIRLREIKENMLRFELTALDRAVHLATWKEIYEAAATPAKRGRKAKARTEEELRQDSAAFSESFSAAAAKALQVSERSVRVAIQIASGIGPDIRERISAEPIADIAAELLQLSAEDPERKAKIVDLLLPGVDGGVQAGSVAMAIAILDATPQPIKLSGWEKIADRFARLREVDRFAFFEAQAAEIARWQASKRRR